MTGMMSGEGNSHFAQSFARVVPECCLSSHAPQPITICVPLATSPVGGTNTSATREYCCMCAGQ